MTVLTCDCGLAIWVVREEELLTEARRHALEAHGMEFTDGELLTRVSDHGSRPAPGDREAQGTA